MNRSSEWWKRQMIQNDPAVVLRIKVFVIKSDKSQEQCIVLPGSDAQCSEVLLLSL